MTQEEAMTTVYPHIDGITMDEVVNGRASPQSLAVVGSPTVASAVGSSRALSTVPLSTGIEEDGENPFTDDASSSPGRLRYVGKVALGGLAEKLKKGHEIRQEDLVTLAAPDKLPDSELLVPVQLDSTGSVAFHGGARGAAASLISARSRCEAMEGSEAITAKEWRALGLEADGVLKPYLFALVVFTALGAGTLLTMTRDASPPFLLSIMVSHIGPEIFLLNTFFLAHYIIGCLIVTLAPTRESDDLAGPVGLSVFLGMAAISDAVCLWFGGLLCLRRPDLASRRLGAGLFCHGLAGQLAAAEFLHPGLFNSTLEKEDQHLLQGLGWVLMALVTAFSMSMIVPIFSIRCIDIRLQRPSMPAAGVVFALAAATVLCQPLIAGDVPDLCGHQNFCRGAALLAAYKMLSSIGGIVLALYTMNEFNIAKQRPLSPTFSTFIGSTIWRNLNWVD
eukprot:CAMPEP_0115768468 /NCGR_PEP_ID=MMETSP0272-20121206/104204_1 /TAXON_ID=71861 /ORGANISM="Scrippsiella trochoidea, Strain CCMP3099" /LENGTH=448 /DNA_ID=CAMNT_0003214513 /DNA_START=70 /DNA_END=1417 /DNA_ORIENTATION=-